MAAFNETSTPLDIVAAALPLHILVSMFEFSLK
jgi:hypothetical protein